jgi:hypothetical protein
MSQNGARGARALNFFWHNFSCMLSTFLKFFFSKLNIIFFGLLKCVDDRVKIPVIWQGATARKASDSIEAV